MKTNRLINCVIVLAALEIMFLLMTGCAQTPKNQIDAGYQEIPIVLSTANVLYTTGAIKVDDYQGFIDGAKSVKAALDKADAARVAGSSDAEQLRVAALALLDNLKTTIAAKEAK